MLAAPRVRVLVPSSGPVAHHQERLGLIVMGCAAIRVDLESRIAEFNALLRLSPFQVHQTLVDHGMVVLGIELQGLIKGRHGPVRVVNLKAHAHVVPDLGLVGSQLDAPLEQVVGQSKLLRLHQDIALNEQRHVVVEVVLQNLVAKLQRQFRVNLCQILSP